MCIFLTQIPPTGANCCTYDKHGYPHTGPRVAEVTPGVHQLTSITAYIDINSVYYDFSNTSPLLVQL